MGYHPGYFGKVGMRYFHELKQRTYCPVINVEKVWSLVDEKCRLHFAEKTDKAVVIDVTKHGFFKVVGKGNLPKQPVIVKARYFSKMAEQKIKSVGGCCILVA